MSYLCVMSMLLCRLKEESKWSQSYYAYLCGGEFFRTATGFQLADFMGTFRGVRGVSVILEGLLLYKGF